MSLKLVKIIQPRRQAGDVVRRPFVLFFLGAWFLLFQLGNRASASWADMGREVRISAIENEQTHVVAMAVLREAYNRLGFRTTFDLLPARRALEWANSGITRGDVARIAGTENSFPNLIPVPTPVVRFSGVAFAKRVKRPVSGWKDLVGLRVGIIRGIRYSEIGTRGMAPVLAKDMTHLFKLLVMDRIDVAVAVLNAGRVEISRNYRDAGFYVLGSPLFTAPLYHFVHIGNRSLVPELHGVLLEMTDSGELAELQRLALEKLTGRELK